MSERQSRITVLTFQQRPDRTLILLCPRCWWVSPVQTFTYQCPECRSLDVRNAYDGEVVGNFIVADNFLGVSPMNDALKME